ncbi:PDZ domain-containing protein [Microbulbifer guangxiensis]|uniref:PDZ domain-containing protein n=1 Tax=Microbulbifer guangxiensis TaxID=2904249 RepID=UPI001F2B629C|nr:PDZ domain-containing protein [Microbulbifer guangxiensis]
MNRRLAGIFLGTVATLAVGAATLSSRNESQTAAYQQKAQEPQSVTERLERLEQELEESRRFQRQLLDLVEELRQSIEGDTYVGEPTTNSATMDAADSGRRRHETAGRSKRLQQYRDSQLERLIDAGMDPARAQFVLEKTERFQFEHTRLSYQYRHLADKSSEEALALRRELEIHSNPQRMFSHLLSPEEFDLYLEANGRRQQISIDRIVPDTPAHDAGLRAGDRIISYNGERIFHMGDLRQQVYRVPPGKMVAVEIERAGSNNRETIYVPSGPLGIQG